MKISEIKQKALALLDEIGGSKTAKEYEDKFNRFIDIGQREICAIYPLIKTQKIKIKPGEENRIRTYILPSDLRLIAEVYNTSYEAVPYKLVANTIVLDNTKSGDVIVEYQAEPKSVTNATPDTTSLEIDAIACECLSYFIASQCLIHENDQRPFQNLYSIYQGKMQNLSQLWQSKNAKAGVVATVKGGVKI